MLDGPKSVEIAAGGAKADLKLNKSRNLTSQLSNGEWLASAPGPDSQKAFLTGCTSCHTLQRVFTAVHSAEEWEQVFNRMGRYYPGSTPAKPQLLVQGGARSERPRVNPNVAKAAAEYLVSVSLSNPEAKEYDLKTLPRPKGVSTKVIYTEYDLPRKEALPHDVVVDADGHAWYSDFGSMYVGELDPKTGKVTDYPIPVIRDEQPKGTLDLELDPRGNLWIALMYQSGIAKIDRKSKELKVYPYPKEWLVREHAGLDGVADLFERRRQGVVEQPGDARELPVRRRDRQVREPRHLEGSARQERQRLRHADRPRQQRLYARVLGHEHRPAQRQDRRDHHLADAHEWLEAAPRQFDEQNRLWFAEYGSNGIGMFDPKTDKITEWVLPTKWDTPYDVVPAKNGEVWAGSMQTDLVTRLDPKTGTMVEYLLPKSTNIRRVFVEETGPRPVLWVGCNHGASIVKVEPLE